MSLSIEVVARAGDPADNELRVRVHLAAERITVRALLERTVVAQIEELLHGQKRGQEAALRTLARQYMTEAEIETQAATGSVRFPVPVRPELVDVNAEVARAFRGFERRAFRVVANGEMLQSLDEELVLTPDSKVTFLRLMPLKGG